MAYVKQTWLEGELITSEKLNHMEDGIEEAGTSGGSSLPDYSIDDVGKTLTVVRAQGSQDAETAWSTASSLPEYDVVDDMNKSLVVGKVYMQGTTDFIPEQIFTTDEYGYVLSDTALLTIPDASKTFVLGNEVTATIDYDGELIEASGTIQITGGDIRELYCVLCDSNGRGIVRLEQSYINNQTVMLRTANNWTETWISFEPDSSYSIFASITGKVVKEDGIGWDSIVPVWSEGYSTPIDQRGFVLTLDSHYETDIVLIAPRQTVVCGTPSGYPNYWPIDAVNLDRFRYEPNATVHAVINGRKYSGEVIGNRDTCLLNADEGSGQYTLKIFSNVLKLESNVARNVDLSIYLEAPYGTIAQDRYWMPPSVQALSDENYRPYYRPNPNPFVNVSADPTASYTASELYDRITDDMSWYQARQLMFIDVCEGGADVQRTYFSEYINSFDDYGDNTMSCCRFSTFPRYNSAQSTWYSDHLDVVYDSTAGEYYYVYNDDWTNRYDGVVEDNDGGGGGEVMM